MSAMCHACIGGTNVREDIRKLEMGVHVVVGTPGRVYDMINRKALGKLHLLSCTKTRICEHQIMNSCSYLKIFA